MISLSDNFCFIFKTLIENRCNGNVIVIVHSVTVQVTVTSSCQGLLLEQTSASGMILSNTGYSYHTNMERGKPEYPEKNLSEQGREPTTNSTHI